MKMMTESNGQSCLGVSKICWFEQSWLNLPPRSLTKRKRKVENACLGQRLWRPDHIQQDTYKHACGLFGTKLTLILEIGAFNC